MDAGSIPAASTSFLYISITYSYFAKSRPGHGHPQSVSRIPGKSPARLRMDPLPDHWDGFSVRRGEAGRTQTAASTPCRAERPTRFSSRDGDPAVPAGARFRALVLHPTFRMVPSRSPNQDTHHRQFCGLQAQT